MIIALIILFAGFVQGAAGFGLALVAMPLLVQFLGLQTAAPLMSLVGSTAGIVLLIYYRDALTMKPVLRLIAAAVIGIPLGILLLKQVDGALFSRLLGGVVLLYALYGLLTPSLPRLEHAAWGVGLGFLSGLLTGAYAIGGPPVIIYGTCRRWETAVFKSNLQAFFFVTGLFLIANFALSGSYTALVWTNFLYALPALAVGLAAGFTLDRYLDAARFRRLVLVLLILLSLQLIFA